jgi:hypothetical protein
MTELLQHSRLVNHGHLTGTPIASVAATAASMICRASTIGIVARHHSDLLAVVTEGSQSLR